MTIENDDAASRPVDEPTKADEVANTNGSTELTEGTETQDASNTEVVPSEPDSVEKDEATGDEANVPLPVPPISEGVGDETLT